ncbi:MAG TPA: hypothetical protein VEK36_02310 [Candidatus Paceibacterota bacterium]|nr:hypothetical protein [Candidatus Paceibacterota bacterium]
MNEMLDLRQKKSQKTLTTVAWDILPQKSSRRNRFLMASFFLIFAVLFLIRWHDNILGILFISIALLVVLPLHPEVTQRVEFADSSIIVNERKFYYQDIKSFWIEFKPEVREVSIEFKRWYLPYLRIPLENQNPLELRQALIHFLPEKEHTQSLVDLIVRWLQL